VLSTTVAALVIVAAVLSTTAGTVTISTAVVDFHLTIQD